MEQDIKQHTMVFNKGLTSSPSDLLCDDDTLEVCDGITVVNGEWKALQDAEFLCEHDAYSKLMCVHRGEGYANQIVACFGAGSSWVLRAFDIEHVDSDDYIELEGSFSSIKQVTSIGNTLIANTDKGAFFYLWTSGNYKPLGNKIPDINIRFNLGSRVESYTSTNTSEDYYFVAFEGSQELLNALEYEIKDVVIGSYSQNKKDIAKNGRYCLPFFAVACIELHNGSYTKMTSPVLMFPSVTSNTYWKTHDKMLHTYTLGCHLECQQQTDYSDWKDIIKGVSVFVSNGVEVMDTENINLSLPYSTTFATDGIPHGKFVTSLYGEETAERKNICCMTPRDGNAVVDDIKNTSLFYKVADLGVRPYGNAGTAILEKKDLRNLVTFDRISTLDYFSHTTIKADRLSTYNRRLNAIGISRTFFDGFSHFASYTSNDGQGSQDIYYKIFVYIRTVDGEKVVCKEVTTNEFFYEDMWFYYPDPRAYKAVFYRGGSYLFEMELKEHGGLNGAYHIGGLPNGTETRIFGHTSIPPSVENEAEKINNYVLQSEVDNPFVFSASGYVRVGQGEIIGIAGLTTALSQDAYKVSTTLAFTTQGIWALTIDSTGQYAQVHPPFSSEVCCAPNSITMADGAVFFVSKKGLMCVTGTNEASVVCVSEQLRDHKPFMDALLDENMRIAYDYRASLLYILAGEGHDNWVYNIKSQMWSTHNALMGDCTNENVVPDYPDTLIQDRDNGKVYSLYNKPLRIDDEQNYGATMKSRPMKFEGSLILKSIRQIKHLKMLNESCGLTFKMYGSNDLKVWTELHSVRGKGYRFFKFEYEFEGMKATDSFAGTIAVTQEKHTDKLR